MNNKVNIKRSYFNENEYGKIIDNSFRELSISRTGSISDFVDNFLRELPNMPSEILDFFVSESENFTSSFDSSTEVDRLNSMITSSLEEQALTKDADTNEHPIIPNGSFVRTTKSFSDNGRRVRLKDGKFYYIEGGFIRKIDSPTTFIQIFKAKTQLNPYDKQSFVDNVPMVEQSFIDIFPQGLDLTKDVLTKESFGDEQRQKLEQQDFI